MRLIYLHQYFKTPQMSGGTRSYEFAKRLVHSGHKVHMITTHQGNSYSKKSYKEKVDGIDVYYLFIPYDNSFNYVKRIIAFIKYIFISSFYIQNIKCDIIFATSTPLTVAIPALLYKKLKGVPMVFEVRDLWPEIPIAIGLIKSNFLIKVARILEKTAYFNSEYIIALSPGIKAGVMNIGIPKTKLTTIPNSCDLKMFNVPESVGIEYRRNNKWLEGRKLVVYAGTFGYINDISYLVYLSKEMSKINDNVVFLVIGEGKEEKKIYYLAKKNDVLNNNFFIMPPINKEEISKILSAATICTSLFKPLPEMRNNSANKFFDALAAGKPIMINYEGWQSELLRKTGAGLTVPQNNVPKSAKLLSDFISDEDNLEKASYASKRLGEKKFNRDLLYNKFEKTLIGSIK